MARKKAPAKKTTTATRRVAGGLPCPDCDFVARHAMGLGRHRAARHGAIPKRRQARIHRAPVPADRGAWLTRYEAAKRVGVHYNTIRHWEQKGVLRRCHRPGVRGVLVHAEDVDGAAGRAGSSTVSGRAARQAEALTDLERRYSRLVVALEELLAEAKSWRSPPPSASRAPRRRKGR